MMYTPDRWHDMQEQYQSPMAQLEAMRRDVQGSVVMPPQIFFQPKDAFMVWLKNTIKDRIVVDLGCGMGHMIEKGRTYGIKILGTDTGQRTAQHEEVLPFDARQWKWDTNQVALVCRPDHSGWCAAALERALLQDVVCYYISKPINYTVDLADWGLCGTKVFTFAGRDNETVYKLSPFSDKKKLKVRTQPTTF